MKKILIISPYYYPGYRSGGPQQTFMNIVDAYGDRFCFYILTLNHDMGIKQCYSGVNKLWNEVGKARVRYVSDKEISIGLLSDLSNNMDVVYSGGLFDRTTRTAIIAKKNGKIKCPLWVAPMGVFSGGAIAHKRLKKLLYIYICKLLGMFSRINWSFSSQYEMEEFERYLGKPRVYEIARDIPKRIKPYYRNIEKEIGSIKVIFLSRICFIKNLLYALEIVSKLSGKVLVDIYGTREDSAYWSKCESAIRQMPKNVTCEYKGEVENKEVCNVFSHYDVFLFPTIGENFGHVIYESMISGCIPIISDRTPWRNFDEYQCGNVISLDNKEEYIKVLQNYVNMNSSNLQFFSYKCINYALRCYDDSVSNSGYLKIF